MTHSKKKKEKKKKEKKRLDMPLILYRFFIRRPFGTPCTNTCFMVFLPRCELSSSASFGRHQNDFGVTVFSPESSQKKCNACGLQSFRSPTVFILSLSLWSELLMTICSALEKM